jgi:uncharacterized protein (TIGR00725 family)
MQSMSEREGHAPAFQLGVIGAGAADSEISALAREVGVLAAGRGWVILCGGMGGVMEAVSEGAAESGGLVVGLLPGSSRSEANRHVGVALPTNMGHGRNVLIAQASDVIIAIGGGYGTLSEMALGLKMGKPVVSLRSWRPDDGVLTAETAAEAMAAASRSLGEDR